MPLLHGHRRPKAGNPGIWLQCLTNEEHCIGPFLVLCPSSKNIISNNALRFCENGSRWTF